MSIEQILAGPIVRRVSTEQVSVWVAHSVYGLDARHPVEITLQIYRTPQGDDEPIKQVSVPSVRVGDRLHIALPTAEFGPGERLEPGKTYAYDVRFDGAGLRQLGLLDEAVINGHRHLPLGYVPGLLPTFRTLPARAEDLVIAHGSCRKTGGPGPDAMVALDQVIDRRRENEATRPHVLFLTGDQLYVDDPSAELLEWMSDLGVDLIGRNAQHKPIERLRVDLPIDEPDRVVSFPADKLHFPPGRRQRLVSRAGGFSSVDNFQHAMSFGEIAAEYLMSWCNVSWPHLDDQQTWKDLFKARKDQVERYLTAWRLSFDAMRNQLIANKLADAPSEVSRRLPYVDGWLLMPPTSLAIDLFAEEHPRDWHRDESHWREFWLSSTNPLQPPVNQAIGAKSGHAKTEFVGAEPDLVALSALFTPAWYAGVRHYEVKLDYKVDETDPAKLPPTVLDHMVIESDHVLENLKRLRGFYQALPFVRRALANISSLMMFDDHEVTDDWASDRAWVEGVQRRVLGRDLTRNALLAYALFQDWGNAPQRYTDDPVEGTRNQRIVELTPKLFYDDNGRLRSSGPDETARNELEVLFDPTADEAHRATWMFSITDPQVAPYEILLLDSRTRRGYDAAETAPAPIAFDEIAVQIPDVGPAESKLSIVISPLPILGFPPVEQMKPMFAAYAELTNNAAKFDPDYLFHLGVFPEVIRDYSFGRMDYDPDPWAFHPAALDRVLARLSTRKAVIFLSGDIHFAMSAKLTYWKHSTTGLIPTTRFAQLVSSALRNEPGLDRRKYAEIGFAEQLSALISGPYDRLGWSGAGVNAPTFDGGSYWLRRLTDIKPVLVPTRMLPEGALAAIRAKEFAPAPEWAWRADLIKDDRADVERYGTLPGAGASWDLIKPEALLADVPAGARQIALHHGWHARFGSPRRQFMFSNIGLVHFEREHDGAPLHVVHSLYSWDHMELGPGGGPINPTGPWPDARLPADAYTQYRISLDPTDEPAPDQPVTP